MSVFNINKSEDEILEIAFGQPAHNDEIVVEVSRRMSELVANGTLDGGDILKINGPASLPAAMCIAHSVGHLYQAIACYDPKMRAYVVAIAHGGKYQVGDLIQ